MRSSCEERKPSLPESVPFWCDSQSTKNSDTSPGAEYTTNAQISASSITLRTDECHRGRARSVVISAQFSQLKTRTVEW